jgi:hypothetical protein
MDSKSPEVVAAMKMAERLVEYNRGFTDDERKWKYNLVSDRWEPMKL